MLSGVNIGMALAQLIGHVLFAKATILGTLCSVESWDIHKTTSLLGGSR